MNKIHILILLLILILILILFSRSCTFTSLNELFSVNNINNLTYLNKSELEDFLLSDTDNYYKSFSELDMKARNINNLDEYYEKIKKSCITPNSFIRNILDRAVLICDKKIKKYKIDGFDGEKCSKIKWIIGMVKNNEYENGFPHTRGNVIVIPVHLLEKDNFIKTMIHEKIHIYQKLYPNDINIYLDKYGFTKFIPKTSDIRANPDLDNWIYKNKDGEIMKKIYNQNPKSLSDVKTFPSNNLKNEHPYEWMAYDLAHEIDLIDITE